MTTTTLGTTNGVLLPSVNLLPPEVVERRKLRRTYLQAGAVVAATAVAVGGLYMMEHSKVGAARSELEAAQHRVAQLQAEQAQLQSVSQVYADVAAQQGVQKYVLAGEVRWSHYLNDLSMKVPDSVWLKNITAKTGSSGPQRPAAAATGQCGTGPGTVGQMTFGGTAFTHDDVATWLETLAQEKGFADPYFSNSTAGAIGKHPVVNFSSTVDLSQGALSCRYAGNTGGTQ